MECLLLKIDNFSREIEIFIFIFSEINFKEKEDTNIELVGNNFVAALTQSLSLI